MRRLPVAGDLLGDRIRTFQAFVNRSLRSNPPKIFVARITSSCHHRFVDPPRQCRH